MENASRPYRVGIVGCGRAGIDLHLPALRELDAVEVVALADIDADRLEDTGNRWGNSTRCSEPESLVADPEVDIVLVCVPVRHHVEVALAALEAGKHVLIEKPLSLELPGCDELVRAASKQPVTVMVGFNMRFHRLVRQAKAIIASGELGEIEAVTSKWTSAIRHRQVMPEWRNHRDQGGGALFEISVHHLDLWRFLFESDIAEIHAFGRSRQSPDQTVSLNARMENGILASGVFSERSSDGNELEVVGSRGILKLSLFRYDGLKVIPVSSQPGLARRLADMTRTLASIPGGISIMRRGGDFRLSYRREWCHFIDAIGHGSTPESTLNDGREAVRAVLAAVESMSTGRPVAVKGAGECHAAEPDDPPHAIGDHVR